MSITLNPAQIEQFGPPTAENLEIVVRVARVNAALNYAGITIMLWDMLLTLPAEVCSPSAVVVTTHPPQSHWLTSPSSPPDPSPVENQDLFPQDYISN